MREQLSNKALFEQAKRHSFEYIDQVDQLLPTFPAEDSMVYLSMLDEPVQAGSKVLEQLHTYGAPATTTNTGGRYFGYVNGIR